jgi:hypothetical protein
MLTWDSKITTVLGMTGGLYDIVSKRLKSENLYNMFMLTINKEWSVVFGAVTKEKEVGYASPTA